jgi:dinuclear metal center YbgI/SA1388 family protein
MKYQPTAGGLADFLNDWAPTQLAESYDNVGLLVGNPDWPVERVLVALDTTEALVEEAISLGAQAIVSHHPVLFSGLKKITGKTEVERVVERALVHKIALLCAHTNLDAIQGGVSTTLADRLGLHDVRILAPRKDLLLQLVTWVPIDHAENVREALFAAGAGQVGVYDECGFLSEGEGTFRPLPGSKPFLGSEGIRKSVREMRLEVLVPKTRKEVVVQALKKAHPYEEVAHYWVENGREWSDVGFGAVGEWAEGKSWKEALAQIKEATGATAVKHTKIPEGPITRVAVCGGSGGELLEQAQRAGAQLFITGDIKYHRFFDADERCALVDVGHGESEQHTVEIIVAKIRENFRNFAVLGADTRTNPVTIS